MEWLRQFRKDVGDHVGLLSGPLALVLVHFTVITREERYLERTFGEDYRAYKARVRRWI